MSSNGLLSSALSLPLLPLLSLPLQLLSPALEPQLPVLPSSSRQGLLMRSTPPPHKTLPKTNAYVFTVGLFKRTLLDTLLASILYACL